MLPFSAVGDARGTVATDTHIWGRFSVKNGHISYNCDQSEIAYYVNPYFVSVTGFQDDAIPPPLMTEFKGKATAQMSNKLAELYLGLANWNALLKNAMCQFMTEIFTVIS